MKTIHCLAGGLLLSLPLASHAQTTDLPTAPHFYVGLGVYSSDYQPFSASYRGLRVPLQLALGYQLRPRLAVQLGGVFTTVHEQATGITSYYTGPTGTTGFKTLIYNSSSTSANTSLQLLARYTLTRRPTQRFQLDVLGGLTLEMQHYSDYNNRVEYDSTNTQTASVHNSSDYRHTDALLTIGLSPRLRFTRHLEAVLDLSASHHLTATGRGRTGAASLGLRYRFGGLH